MKKITTRLLFNRSKQKTRINLLCKVAVIVFLFCASATKGYAQQKYSISFKDRAIATALTEIQRTTGYNFLYVEGLFNTSNRVTAELKEATIQDILNTVLVTNGFSYRINNRDVTITKAPPASPPAQKERDIVRGVVMDSEKKPLLGVSIFIKGTNRGGVTDEDGTFTVRCDLNDVLLFRYLGKKEQEVVYSGQSILSITLDDASEILEDVVVTGIFKKARESYTGAATTIDKEDLQMFRGQNLLQTLSNIDISLNMPYNNLLGSDPNMLPELNIRGTSSLPLDLEDLNQNVRNDVNTPLILLDGFPISLTSLMDYNDEEIETITILKDAAATAIYGSRASNGVIVVTTKEPVPGELKIIADLGLTIEVPDLRSYDLLNAREKLELENMLGLYIGRDLSQTIKLQNTYNYRLQQIQSGVDTYWLSQPLRTGVGQRYNARLEGGSESFRWSVSARFQDTQGAMKDSYRKNFSGTSTLSYNYKNLIFKNILSVTVNNSQESKYGSFSQYVNQQPYNAITDSKGDIIPYFYDFERVIEVANPLYDMRLDTKNQSEYKTITEQLAIDWNPFKGFTIRGQFGISNTRTTSDKFYPKEHSMFLASEYQSTDGALRKGLYQYSTDESNSYSLQITPSYNLLLGDKHNIYAGLSFNLEESKWDNKSFDAEGFLNNEMSEISNALQYLLNGNPGGNTGITRTFGAVGNITYNYDNRYYVDFSYRADGSSNFGTDKKIGSFWSASAGWSLHNEKFLEESPIISQLRLKGSYGVTGAVNEKASGIETTYGYSADYIYYNWIGAKLLGLGNPLLSWQKTYSYNVGVEFSLLDNLINGSFDYYSKKTDNLLSYMDLPPAMGFNQYLENIGEVKNNGFEASLNIRLIKGLHPRSFNWSIGGQLAYTNNEISKISEAVKALNDRYLNSDDAQYDIANLYIVGRPQNNINAVRSLGIDPSNGKEIFLDKSGRMTYIWNATDKVFIGGRDPKFRGNFNTRIFWNNLSLSVSCGYHWGGVTYNSTLLNRVEVTTNQIKQRNVDSRVLYDRWMKPGDHVAFKKPETDRTRSSSRFIVKDREFSINNISLQYKWDDKIVKSLGLQTITFGFNMSNIARFSSVKIERGTSYPFAYNIQGSIRISL